MLKTPEQIKEEAKKTLEEKEQSWGVNTARTTEQIEEEIRNFLNKVKQEWTDHLSLDGKKDYILGLREKSGPHITEQVQQVLVWIDEAQTKDNLESWKELYGNWNGDLDTSKTKYNGKKDLCGYLSSLRIHLENWERVSYEQSQQELIEKLRDILQVIGISPDDENIQKEVEEIKKVQDDLVELGIDKSEVKETIENERNEYKVKNKWLIDNYLEEDIWEEINIEARIEAKEK